MKACTIAAIAGLLPSRPRLECRYNPLDERKAPA